MATPILDITELANGQVDQYLTGNAAFRALEAAANAVASVDMEAEGAALTLAELRAAGLFLCIGHTVARALTVPALQRFFCVANGGTGTVSVEVGTTSIDVIAGQMRGFFADGTANGLFVLS